MMIQLFLGCLMTVAHAHGTPLRQAQVKRFLLLFGHQYNNPADMSNEFGAHGVPGDATYYLDDVHKPYDAASGGHAGTVHHAGTDGPSFAAFANNSKGDDPNPGKCPWITCSFDCQDIDVVTGCVICKASCATSGSGSNVGSLSGAGTVGTGSGSSVSGSNSPVPQGAGSGTNTNIGAGTLTGAGITGSGINGAAGTLGGPTSGSTGTSGNGATSGSSGAAQLSGVCPPFPSNCPRGSVVLVNGCPECHVATSAPTTQAPVSTTTAVHHGLTCAPLRCVAPCDKGVKIDPTTRCPACIC